MVLRAISEHQLKKVLVYFSLVSDTRRLARELPHTLRLLHRAGRGRGPGCGCRLQGREMM
ncbi:hypothetical protein AMK31_37625 [Streptomyces sp. TSRI0107]|nr:hypothetical protein AMK31_37625 [Streptomyces sp. TSRI0107]